MWDSIKSFFQDMYDSVIAFFIDKWDSLTSFFNILGDISLVLIILVLAFVVFKLLRYITLPTIILGQILMLTAIITAMLAFIAVLASALVSIYNRMYALADYISSSASSFSCASYMIDCLSINGVMSAFFTELFALFVTVLLIKMSGLFLWAMNMISDKLWKLGVLLGLV